MQLYVERFNRRDWDGVRLLISADARLNVADALVSCRVANPRPNSRSAITEGAMTLGQTLVAP